MTQLPPGAAENPAEPLQGLSGRSLNLRLEDVHKSYGSTRALAGADFELGAGSSMAILGRSGSGKSTLLRIVAGLEEPDSGHVFIDDQLASEPGYSVPAHKRGLGLVFQSSALWPHMTVAQNILFGVRDSDRAARQARLAELCEGMALTGLEKRYPDRLSGGEARRVALARALAPRPGLLLFDEAFTHLDWELRSSLWDLVNSQVRSRATLLIVTHDPDEADALADSRLLLADGRLSPWTAESR
jgi:iron(III) transport system ATP-binding protein